MGRRIINLAVTVDTECDKGEKWQVRQPLSFENTRSGLRNNLQPIFDRHCVKATYLLSPEVIEDDESVSYFKSLGNSVELGTHLHSEYIEPEADFDSPSTDHYQSDFPYEIEFEKLKNLTGLFKRTFGYKPASFRAGRFGISHNTLSQLQELGYLVDSSVTPDIMWKNTNGNSANFHGTPYQPYFPSSKDFRKYGDLQILEVPVSTINPKLVRLPLWVKRRINLKTRYHHIFYNILTHQAKTLWLRPTYSDVDAMKLVTELLIRHARNDKLFLCMMFHSNEFTLGASPYSLNQEAVDLLQDRLDRFFKVMQDSYNIKYVGLADVAREIQ